MTKRHPTPLEIRAAIQKALHDDFEQNGGYKCDNAIPFRVHGIVDKAISQACEEVAQ